VEWKDELPRKGLTWSGRRLHGGQASFLCPDLLAGCHPHAGAPDDFRQAPLSDEARRVAETLLASGPLPAAATWPTLGVTALPCAFSLRVAALCLPSLVDVGRLVTLANPDRADLPLPASRPLDLARLSLVRRFLGD